METDTVVAETSLGHDIAEYTGKTVAVVAIVTAGVLVVGVAQRWLRNRKPTPIEIIET